MENELQLYRDEHYTFTLDEDGSVTYMDDIKTKNTILVFGRLDCPEDCASLSWAYRMGLKEGAKTKTV